jgi:peptidoglycan/LPS O-acetylase OafA/YrhL
VRGVPVATVESRSILPDAVRGIASLVVAAAHAWQIFLLPYTGLDGGMWIAGGLAVWSVSIFFLLSGDLIGGSIRRQVAAGTFSIRKYAEDRALRIYPPLFLAVGVTVSSVTIIQYFNLYGATSYHTPGDLGSARASAEINWFTVLPTLTTTYRVVPGE